MKWLLRFSFFVVLIVVMVWAWLNPVNLWFAKPFSSPVSQKSFDSVLIIKDSLEKAIIKIQQVKQEKTYQVRKQERKLEKKIIKYEEDKTISNCDQIIEEINYLQVQYVQLQIISDSVISNQFEQIKKLETIVKVQNENISNLEDHVQSLNYTIKNYQIKEEFTNRKLRNYKRIGIAGLVLMTLILIR